MIKRRDIYITLILASILYKRKTPQQYKATNGGKLDQTQKKTGFYKRE
jgi:hypothetical protein